MASCAAVFKLNDFDPPEKTAVGPQVEIGLENHNICQFLEGQNMTKAMVSG